MNKTPSTLYVFFGMVFLITLAACGTAAPAVMPTPTDTSIPTVTSEPPIPTPTILYPPATLTPAWPTPLPVMTDTTQVERWKEYQTELAKALFVYNPEFPQIQFGPEEYKDALCEWDILGRSGQEMYMWATCESADGLRHPSTPVVIFLELDGSIQKVDVASIKIDRPESYLIYDLHQFPTDIQERLCLYYFSGYMPQCYKITSAYIPLDYQQSRENVLLSHLKHRKEHRDELPLVVLSAIPKVTSMP